MVFARGSQSGLRYVAETIWGTTPGSPSTRIFRNTGNTLGLSKQTFQTAELRSDRQITDFRHGTRQVSGDISFELIYGPETDAFLESAAFGAFGAAAPYNLTGLNISVVAAARTFTRASGSFITGGVRVGDTITTSGFTNAGNNGTFVVVALTATVITVGGVGGLVNESGDGNEAVTTPIRRLVAGTTMRSFTIERAHLDVTQFMIFTGMVVNTWRVTAPAGGIVTGTFGMIGRDMTVSGTSIDATPDPASTNSPMDANTGDVRIVEGTAAITVATSVEFNLDNGLEAAYAIANVAPAALVDKRSNMTGTLSAYLVDASLVTKFIAEAESSLEMIMRDPAGNGYRVWMPRIKYAGADVPVAGEGPIELSLPFQALLDPTMGTNLIIDRLPRP